ncbi:xylosyltransferase oxt [Aplysia californica]|uniref:protein xylosyltransferase n=1 Tax=Aplysia californica TaxID=6500 RepID=A0ABM1ACA0_APLCA|nr:xylosyltransferase oxt [Aplysia californica]
MAEFSDNTPDKCIQHCLRCGQKYAAVQYGKECWCGPSYGKHGSLEAGHCFSKCPGNASLTCGAYLSSQVYGTGVTGAVRQDAPLARAPLDKSVPKVKIVFVLTVNGRAIRQVIRLLRVIYSPDHYYYIHVDKRQEYLFRELLPLENRFTNVMLTRNRFATIWGGASLLQAHLSFLQELLEPGLGWNWDYYINLSESDYPIKPLSQLTDYLTTYKGLNFLKSHGKNTPRFIKKQGLDQTFHECENHLWRVSHRPLPRGIVLDGGSDWIGLWREFAHYVVTSTDQLVTGLKDYYKYSLLPVESFFHTVLQNSRFCQQSVDNNLHITNWRRKQGCKCQYKHIVDWCGCSPNDFKITDMEKLLNFDKKPVFFARKFEAVIDQEIINSVDRAFHGFIMKELPGLSSYWQNTFHHLDTSTKVKDAARTIYRSLTHHTAEQLMQTEPQCEVKATKLLEVNLYQHSDHFHGLLVQFSAQFKDTGHITTFESLAEPRRHYSVIDPKGSTGRLQSLEVGTDFDLKELIFRNYGNLLGPFDDLSLRHEWGPGPEFTVSIAWVDPTNEIAASYDVHIPSSHYVGNQRPQLNRPLRPGVWSAKLMIDLKLVAETQFLVAPLTFHNNKPISVSEILRSHQGPIGTYTSTDFSEFMPNLNLVDSPKLRQEASDNGKKTGVELDQWIDSLTALFWVVRETCAIEQLDACPQLEQCKMTSWSSRSPDVKSDPKHVGSSLPLAR